MRKLLTILLFFSVAVQGQWAPFVLTSGTGYGQANSMRMAGAIHLAGTNAYGNKEGWIIYEPGKDHRAATPVNNTDYSGVVAAQTKGIAKLLASADMPYFHKPGGNANANFRWNSGYMVPSTDFTTIPFAYVSELIKRICSLYGTTTDTTVMMYVGYSLGAGAGESMSKDPYIASHISAWYNIAGGYNASPNYQFAADSTGPIKEYHSASDGTAPVSISDGFVNGLNAKKPVHPVQYIRFANLTGTDHDAIRFIMEDTVGGGSYLLSNGDTWVNNETIFVNGLRYTTKRRKR